MNVVWIVLASIALAVAPPAPAAPAVGLQSIEIEDAERADPVAPQHRCRWRVDLYYPSALADRSMAPYAPDPKLIEAMMVDGYYDVPQDKLRAWAIKVGPANRDARPAKPQFRHPLVIIAPGSGIAAFNYARLASTLVARGYAVAVVDLPYVGVSRLSGGRLLRARDYDGLAGEDPVSWRPAIRTWSRDVSKTIDHLLGPASPLLIDPERVLITGHSTGGTVALQVCHDEPRVLGCGDFEGAPQASDAFDAGTPKPIFVTASRSAKPDRSFEMPDLAHPFWSYLGKNAGPAWAVAITKASHMSYSDAPYEMPDTLNRFGGELMPAEQSEAVLTGLVDAFFRSYGQSEGGERQLTEFFARTPEIKASRAGGR